MPSKAEIKERLEFIGRHRMYEVLAPRMSGRTTRMMQEAIGLAQTGKLVYVICRTMSHKRMLEQEWAREIDGLSIKIETPLTIGPGWDWRTLRGAGMHPECEVLVDNWAIEGHFMQMLNMLRRWDEIEP